MTSRCPHCKGFTFELVEQSPTNARYKLWFVQCSICKAPVGAMEYLSAGAGILDIKNKLEEVDRRMENIESLIRRIVK